MDIISLGKMVKQKFPQYQDMSDEDVGVKVSNKFGAQFKGAPASPGVLARVWNHIDGMGEEGEGPTEEVSVSVTGTGPGGQFEPLQKLDWTGLLANVPADLERRLQAATPEPTAYEKWWQEPLSHKVIKAIDPSAVMPSGDTDLFRPKPGVSLGEHLMDYAAGVASGTTSPETAAMALPVHKLMPEKLGVVVPPERLTRGWIMPDGTMRELTGSHETSIAAATGVPVEIKDYPKPASEHGLIRYVIHTGRSGKRLVVEVFGEPTEEQIGSLHKLNDVHKNDPYFDDMYYAYTDPETSQPLVQGRGIGNLRSDLEPILSMQRMNAETLRQQVRDALSEVKSGMRKNKAGETYFPEPWSPKRAKGGEYLLSLSTKPGAVAEDLTAAASKQDSILRSLGYSERTPQLDPLKTLFPEHKVMWQGTGSWSEGGQVVGEPNAYIGLGKNATLDDAYLASALLGKSWTQNAIGVHMPNSSVPTMMGLRLSKTSGLSFTPSEIDVITKELTSAGVSVEAGSANNTVIKIPNWDGSMEWAEQVIPAIAKLKGQGLDVGAYTGDSHVIGSEAYSGIIEKARNRYGGAQRSSVLDGAIDSLTAAHRSQYPELGSPGASRVQPERVGSGSPQATRVPADTPETSSVNLLVKPLDVVGTSERTFAKKGTVYSPNIVDVGSALEARTKQLHGALNLGEAAPESILERAVSEGIHEIRYQNTLPHKQSGKGWYRSDLREFNKNVQTLHPDTQAPEKMGLFKAITAAMSYGHEPWENVKLADMAYDVYKQRGTIPIIKEQRQVGKVIKDIQWGQSNGDALRNLQAVLSAHRGDEAAAINWLVSLHPVRELNNIKAVGTVAGKADSMLPGAFVLGPKGGPFFMNLMGHPEYLTADMWFSRTWNRWMGTLVTAGKEGPSTALMERPRNDAEHVLQSEAVRRLADRANKELGLTGRNQLSTMDVQAMLWFYEQRLYRSHGLRVDSHTLGEGAKRLVEGK